MATMPDRFSRNEALFGAAGQSKIAATPLSVVGCGGLGSHASQQGAYLGFRRFALIDHDVVTDSSLNRVVTAVDADVLERTAKVDAAARLILAVAPGAVIDKIAAPVADPAAVEAITRTSVVVGCVDHDRHRLEILGICADAGIRYLDLASDTGGSGRDSWYGGRVVLNDGNQCMVCLGLIDQEMLGRDSLPEAQRDARDRSYGIPADALDGTGPAVITINGVVASLAMTELMCMITGLRTPCAQLTYRADLGIVTRSLDRGDPDCWYCARMRRAAAKRRKRPA